MQLRVCVYVGFGISNAMEDIFFSVGTSGSHYIISHRDCLFCNFIMPKLLK